MVTKSSKAQASSMIWALTRWILVELVMAFEEEFNIEIPDDVQESIRTVGDAVTHIKAHI